MALLVQIIVKVSIVLLVAWGVTRTMSRSSAATRHLVWTMAVVVALALPVAQLVAPTWDLPVLPGVRPGSGQGQAPERVVSTPSLDATQVASNFDPEPIAVTPLEPVIEPTPEPATTPWSTASWPTIAVAAWLAITLLAVGRLLIGLAWVSWTTRRANDVTDEGWLQALDEAAAALGVRRPVALRTSSRTTIPVACGIFQPTVMLPADSGSWPMERRRVVLLHELAHVARRDCLTQAIVQLGRALYWFNPLMHAAAARARAEQERACDDLVLAAGTDGPVYADHLIELARSFTAERFPAWATLAMARPSQLEGRVVAILDERCNRRVPNRRARAAMAAAAAAVILPVAALQLTAVAQAPAPAGTQLTAMPVALIDPNPVLPPRDGVNRLDVDVLPTVGDTIDAGVDVLVHAAAQFVDMLPLKPNPDPAPAQKFFTSDTHHTEKLWVADAAPFKAVTEGGWKPGGAASFNTNAQTPNPPAQGGDSTVTDETRRRVADALITALNDENAEVRAEALSSLANMRDARVIPGLLKALGDANVGVRQRALNALGQFSTPEAVNGIVGALKDTNPDIRLQATRQVNALISRGALRDAMYTDVLVGLLKDASPDVREQAIAALGSSRRRELVPTLLPLLKDADIDVRERAAQALGTIADPSAIDSLTAALKDPDPGVREQAARALGQIARGQRRGPLGVPPPPPAAPPAPIVRPGQPSAFAVPVPDINVDVSVDAFRINQTQLLAQRAALRSQEQALRRVEQQLNSADFQRRMQDIQQELNRVQRELDDIR